MVSIVALASLLTSQERHSIGNNPPRLVVVVSIDQFRGDYVDRFWPHYRPAKTGKKLGGFRYLAETGAYFASAVHDHVPNVTGVGHATMMTGCGPAINGVIDNNWFDRATGKTVYCVSDPSVETIGGKSAPMSPLNLKVSTVGDELKMATNGRSKVVGVALKDRASILMAGHKADAVLWFDNETGNFVTSTWYAPAKKLPLWADAFNNARHLDGLEGKSWEPSLPNAAYAATKNAPGTSPLQNGKPFSHALPATVGKDLYSKMWSTPWGNAHTLAAARAAVEGEKLGQDEYPDILVINLSSNDYIGHSYGPNSPEVLDISVTTDAQLSDFMTMLDEKVPGGMGKVAFVVTADHGVVPIAKEAHDEFQIPVASGLDAAYRTVITSALVAKFGPGAWIIGDAGPNLYLDHALTAKAGVSQDEVDRAAADAARSVPGVFNVFTRAQLMNGDIPDYPFKSRITNGYHATMGGDIFLLESPGFYLGGPIGTGHNAIWDYDAHVPILFRAKGIKPGHYLKRVFTNGIAPTLCHLLGIEYPSGNVGVPLVDELDR